MEKISNTTIHNCLKGIGKVFFLSTILWLTGCNFLSDDNANRIAKANLTPYKKVSNNPCDNTELLRVQAVPVIKFNTTNVVYFETGMKIDADGSPHAFHPMNTGLDNNKNAGKPGNWFGVVTDNNMADGNPVLQNEKDPAPGYFVSTTSLIDKTFDIKNPRRYVNSEKIPYFVLPPEVINAADITVGDMGMIYNKKNHRFINAIFADISSIDKIGEGSIALANALGVNSDIKKGGAADGIIYFVFPKSGDRKPKTIEEINAITSKLFEEWGGMSKFRECFLLDVN